MHYPRVSLRFYTSRLNAYKAHDFKQLYLCVDLYMVVIDECHCITERDEAVDQPLYANKKNQHSWTTYAKNCEFSVYNKGYELKNSTELQYYRRFYA